MSQSVKRNAGDAFPNRTPDARHKKRRTESASNDSRSGHAAASISNVNGLKTQPAKQKGSEASSSLVTTSAKGMADSFASPSSSKRKTERKLEKQHKSDNSTHSTTNVATDDAMALSTASNKQKTKDQNAVVLRSKDTAVDVVPAADGALAVNSKSDGKLKKQKGHKTTWTASTRKGGIFINIDPILTADNKYLLLATKYDVHVYSTATSLLIRTINITTRADICACSISAVNSQEILVGTRNGSLTKFDWTTGRRLMQFKTKPGMVHFVSAGAQDECENLFVVTSQADEPSDLWQIEVDYKSSGIRENSLMQLDFFISHIVVSNDLSTVVVFGRDTVHVGRTATSDDTSFAQRQYTWDSLRTKGRIVSCDARISRFSANSKAPPTVDVAVGLQNGAILLYNGLFDQAQEATGVKQVDSQIGRKLHWHRSAVKALKWSPDGNYLVSGGDESVLVIWQLDTNQRQYLPHLTTSILNITISRSGAQYALRLGDNSVMVLSTADLAPSTNIVGLSVLGKVAQNTTLMHPTKPNTLLTATSIRALGARAVDEATHLQSYDVDAQLQLGKQALTRNVVTAVNVAPDGQMLREPNVTHLSLTSDGMWMATTDGWSQSEADTESLKLKEDHKTPQQECTLRIWAWQKDSDSWAPTIKIESPHSKDAPGVVAMAANPVRAEFATIAGDGCLKIWTPKTRLRNGVTIKDSDGNALYNWSCSHTSQLESNLTSASEYSNGSVAYSEDGSVIGAYLLSDSTTSHVHLVDSKSGRVASSQANLVVGNQAQLRFCGQFLVILSDVLTVFDAVSLQVVATFVLNSEPVEDQSSKTKFLAVSPLTNTIAMAAMRGVNSKARTVVSIFEITNSELALKSELSLPTKLRSLLTDSAGRGFVAIDTESGVIRLTSNAGCTSTALTTSSRDELLSLGQMEEKGIDDIFGVRHRSGPAQEGRQLLLEDVHSSSRGLDELLSNNTKGARLSASDLFERVAQVVSGTGIAA